MRGSAYGTRPEKLNLIDENTVPGFAGWRLATVLRYAIGEGV